MGFGLDIPNPLDVLLGKDETGQATRGPDFVIRELTGQQREIRLRGRALPYRPLEFSGSQRTKLTWYQGNPIATQQVLGPIEDVTTVQGMWKDRFMTGDATNGGMLVNGDPAAIAGAAEAVALMNEVRIGGNAVLVNWGPEVRVGILRNFSAKWDREQDVAWSMEFEWSSRGKFKPKPVDIPTPDLAGDLGILDQILAYGLEDIVARFQATLLDVVDQLRENVGELMGIFRAVNNLLAAPAQLIGAIESLVETIRLQVLEETRRLRDTVGWGTGGDGESPSATPAAAALLSTERDRRAVAAALMQLLKSALDVQRVVRDRFAPPEVVVVTIPEDVSFYALSSRYYGTPDLAGFLARRNGIKGTLIAPKGFLLKVPPAPGPGEEQERC